ncbi:MAG: TrbG/VirB9 family P-type conjugative transfer protein [Brevundimonas sp.]
MDPRRFLILAGAGLLLCGCAQWRGQTLPNVSALEAMRAFEAAAAVVQTDPEPAAEPTSPAQGTPAAQSAGVLAATEEAELAPDAGMVAGPPAIEAANRAARTASRSDRFEGGTQVFAWAPGRVFEVWTAPLRVTTLTLGQGETLISRAAGDTVRWQIGEAISGEGPDQRTHVLLKPLERGLETNLVLTTNQRVYLIELRSGGAGAFNAAVRWRAPAPAQNPVTAAGPPVPAGPDPVVRPQGPLDAGYRLESRGRRPAWAPAAVFNDGRRTFIAFDTETPMDEAPALFVIASDGRAQLTNYRQSGGVFIVDRVVEAAELRLGGRRSQVVRILRTGGPRP